MAPHDLISNLAQLVEFYSDSTDLSACQKCFDYVQEFLEKQGLHVSRHQSRNFPSLVATTQPTKKPRVLLQAHLDVVPAAAKLFKLSEKDGRLYGRGVYDMKFAAACYLQLASDLSDKLEQYDFGIMLTSDEEVGGQDGVNYLLNEGYDATVCVLPDGGDDWHLESQCNGSWMIRLIASGQAAHGSRPWEGENAIYNLIEALHEIRQLFGEQSPHQPSLTVSQIRGGAAINQVPDKAMATLDMRFPDRPSYVDKRQLIETLVAEKGLELETLAHSDPQTVDAEHPEIARFIAVAERLRGKPIKTSHSLGASDARFFSQHNIPTIIIRPTGGGAHSDQEWIDRAQLEQFYEVIKAYIDEAAKIA